MFFPSMEEKIDSLFALPYDFYTETGFRKTGLKKLAQMKQFFYINSVVTFR